MARRCLGSGWGLCCELSPCFLLQVGQSCPVERGSWQGWGTQGLRDLASDGRQTLGSQWHHHTQGGLCCCSGPWVGAQEATGLVSLEEPLGFRPDTDKALSAPFQRDSQPFSRGACLPLCTAAKSSPQLALCGVVAGLPPVPWILQPTARPTMRCLGRGLWVSTHLREVLARQVWWRVGEVTRGDGHGPPHAVGTRSWPVLGLCSRGEGLRPPPAQSFSTLGVG